MHSPYKVIFGITLNNSFLRTFGCLCYPNLHSYVTNKLTFYFECCVFLGYNFQRLRYQCLSLQTSKLFISCDVLFNEFFSYARHFALSPPSSPSSSSGILDSIPLLIIPLRHPLLLYHQPLRIMTYLPPSLLYQLLLPHLRPPHLAVTLSFTYFNKFIKLLLLIPRALPLLSHKLSIVCVLNLSLLLVTYYPFAMPQSYPPLPNPIPSLTPFTVYIDIMLCHKSSAPYITTTLGSSFPINPTCMFLVVNGCIVSKPTLIAHLTTIKVVYHLSHWSTSWV